MSEETPISFSTTQAQAQAERPPHPPRGRAQGTYAFYLNAWKREQLEAMMRRAEAKGWFVPVITKDKHGQFFIWLLDEMKKDHFGHYGW
jgi:hypothetical protein